MSQPTSRTRSTTRTRTSNPRGPANRKPGSGPPTKKLTEAARYFIRPAGIKTTAWPSVGETCRRLGATFDPWQDGAARAILGKRADGTFAADAVTLSIPRQVGKTYLVGWIVIGLCIVQPKTLAVWTAHHGATAADTFRDLKAICQQAKVAPFVRSIYDSGARLEIVFTNGSRIVFGAREHGFGRGFKKVGILIFDEAQILTARAADDMVPTTNRHPNPLIFYMGTPPKPSDPSEHFTALRTEALSGESSDTLYLEFSADPGCDPMDREQWAKANPSYPHHTTARAMLRMRKNLKGAGAFEREALGIWDDSTLTGVFTTGAWGRALLKTGEPAPGAPLALGVASDLDQVWLSLGAILAGETPHIGSVLRVRVGSGTATFVAEVKRIQVERGGIPVGIDKKGPGSFLIPELEKAGVVLSFLGFDDYVQACADLVDLIERRGATHGDYADLNDAVDSATWRKVGDRRVFARKNGDISSLESVAVALRASALAEAKPKPFAFWG
ncbi:hypothetical protein P5P86_11805 [Nocardioides sp. BP30]|uniref:hypothetical protein n=1 Tax=Nocardioides sp. BP30 TaxID=3036374 RepID=UPI0024684FA4|nr:hypothetical protein [Nocardioides sp. BP30]WGL50649.1 hypothetical protein P5P86_11805 [Nocardioides sp. BP30]